MAIENIAVSCSFTPVSSCLLGDSLLETDFDVWSSLIFVGIDIPGDSMCAALVCSEGFVHPITDFRFLCEELGEGWCHTQ